MWDEAAGADVGSAASLTGVDFLAAAAFLTGLAAVGLAFAAFFSTAGTAAEAPPERVTRAMVYTAPQYEKQL